MKNKTKQIQLKRELAVKIGKPLKSNLAKTLKAYGKGQLLSSTIKVSYRTIAKVKESGMATPSLMKKLERGLKLIAA